jgi:hypothetical protein
MAKLNSAKGRTPTTKGTRSPITTATAVPDTTTHEGGLAFTRDSKSELFLTAVTKFWGEDTFYEKADDRGGRLVALMRSVAVADPDWYLKFVTWLRGDGNIRTAAIVAAAEGAHAQAVAKVDAPIRRLVAAALQRPDEPGEFLAYWFANISRSPRSHAVQRGLADAVGRLYSEVSMIKYDTPTHGFRFGDVIALARPKPTTEHEATLYKYALDRRRHPGEPTPKALNVIRHREQVMALLAANRSALLEKPDIAEILRLGGMTWEQVAGTGKMDAAAWEAIIPTMGYMALLRNLRNFEQAGVNEATIAMVAERLANPNSVAKSRQLPFRFLSAFANVQHVQWVNALETALSLSVRNIPELPGKTIVLVDTSASMLSAMSAKSTVSAHAAGALFGVALASKNAGAVLYGFADGVRIFQHAVAKGAAVLRTVEAFVRRNGEDGWGTNIHAAIVKSLREHPDAARIVVITDGQCTRGDFGDAAPASMPVYGFDLGGYASTGMASKGNRHHLGGLTDATFGMIATIESASNAVWPWETPAA